MNAVDANILSNIFLHLSCKDLQNIKTMNKQFYNVSKTTFPYLQRFLRCVTNQENMNCLLDLQYSANTLFPYNKDLTYIEIEYWARVGIILYLKKRNKGLLNAITYKLMRFDSGRKPQAKVSQSEFTHEQNNIINCEPIDNHNIIVQAFAGTGKTTTLYEYAKKWTSKQILYITYNKSLAEESKLKFKHLDHVRVSTIHALAYDYLSKHNNAMDDIGNLNVNDVCTLLTQTPECKALTKTELLKKAKQSLNRFNRYINSDESSSDDTYVNLIWDTMFEHKTIKVSHDAYLKWYQLKKVKLDLDVILLDEVQDCTDCILSIILSQNCTRVFVGDRYQKIYSFKNVDEPFNYIIQKSNGNTQHFTLSVSFRMGFDLMYFTNLFLKIKYNELNGFSDCTSKNTNIVNTHVCKNMSTIYKILPKGTVILCRYNVSRLSCMFDLCSLGYTFDCYGKSINFEKEIEIIHDFLLLQSFSTAEIKHPKLKEFNDFDEMVLHFNAIQDNKWNDRINLFLLHSGDTLIDMWTRSKANLAIQNSDFVVTTAHQSKGAEFDNVFLYNDFQIHNQDSMNLMYVAMTRAKKNLFVNKLISNFFEKYNGKVYYDIIMHNKKSKRCNVCKKRNTNTSVVIEADPDTVFVKDCHVYSYEYVCSQCQKLLH